MNKKLLYISAFFLFLLASIHVAGAQTYETWTGEDLQIETDKTVQVTGNIYITGAVTIKSGATLTIIGDSSYVKNIYPSSQLFYQSGAEAMFIIESGGKLVIKNVNVSGVKKTFAIPDPYDTTSGQWQIDAVKTYLENQAADVYKYTTGGIFSVKGSLDLENVVVSDCYSSAGAAVCRPDDTDAVFGTIDIKNCTICRCVSEQQGAAIRLGAQGNNNTNTSCAVTITNSRIVQNISCFGLVVDKNEGEVPLIGGAVCSFNDCISNVTITGSELAYNYNPIRGGALTWISEEDGTKLTLEDTHVHHNMAYRGAGASLLHGTAEMKGCTFDNNQAIMSGGALHLANDISLTAENSIFKENTAKSGGGIYMYIKKKDTHCTMTLVGGQIFNNVAYNTKSDLNTGYDCDRYAEGFGGGVAVVGRGSGDASFILSKGDYPLYIYGNTATVAGDDIFANGNNTAVTLPPAKDIELSEYQGLKWDLNWMEDYSTNDTEYAKGTAIAGDSYSAVRYRDAAQAGANQYPLTVPDAGVTYSNKYLCLTLAPEVIYATIVRIGLQRGENAVFRVSKATPGVNDGWTLFSELVLLGPMDATTPEIAATKSVSKRIALSSGNWKVEETNWAWTYDKEDAITHEITSSSSAVEKAFVFKGTKLKETDEGFVPPERYDESVVRNDFGSGTSETDKGAPASESGFEKITDNGVSW